MKVQSFIQKLLITTLIINSIIPFTGYIIVLAITIYLIINKKIDKLVLSKSEKTFIITCLVYIIITLINSDYKKDSLLMVIIIVLNISLYYNIRTNQDFKGFTIRILYYFKISSIIISLIGILQFYLFQDFKIPSGWIDSEIYDIPMRAFSSLLNPNVLGGYLVFIISLLLTDLESKKNSKLSIASIFLSSYCLIITYSRGAWGTLFIVLFIIFGIRRRLIYIVYGVCYYISILIINGYSGLQRLSVVNTLSDNSLAYRLEIYRTSIEIGKENFLFGTGLNTMQHYIKDYSPVINAPVFHAHNIFLNIWGELGIVGVLLFGTIFISIFKDLYYIMNIESNPKLNLAGFSFTMGFISILLHGFIDAVLLTPQFMIYSIYILGVVKNLRKSQEKITTTEKTEFLRMSFLMEGK